VIDSRTQSPHLTDVLTMALASCIQRI